MSKHATSATNQARTLVCRGTHRAALVTVYVSPESRAQLDSRVQSPAVRYTCIRIPIARAKTHHRDVTVMSV